MVSTIKEAEKHGMQIRRETRYFAVREDGLCYQLQNDWTTEILDRGLVKKAIRKAST